MIDIQNFSIKESLFESSTFSIYQVVEKDNPNILISKVIKQPIIDQELAIQQIEFFLTIHHPSFLPLIGFSLTDFHQNPYLTIICEDLSCIPYSKYIEKTQLTDEMKTKIYLTSLSLFNYFKVRHSMLIDLSLNEFLFGESQNFFPFVTFLSFETSKNEEQKESILLSKIKKELDIKELKEIDDFEFKKSLFLCLNSEEKHDIQLSIDGNIERCLEIGQYFINGEKNYPHNEEEGIHFIKYAADKGNTEAQVLLTSIFNDDPNMQPQALKYCIMAAKNGHFGAISNLGVYYLEGKIINKNYEEAAKLFKIAAENGIVQGMMNYAYCLSSGIGISKNIQESLKYYKKASDLGTVPAMLKYGELTKDKKEKIKYYQKAADLGCSDGFDLLGDLTENIEFYKKAADLGNSKAATKFAYYQSKKGEIDDALKYFEMAAKNNDSTAIYNYLALLHQSNKCNKENMEKVVGFYRSAIQSGDVQSMLNLAELFEEGDDFIDENLDEAKKLYKMASDCGNSEGSLNYGRILEEKMNDISGAIQFYQLAMDEGNSNAMVSIARALMKINGDTEIILELIRKSINEGNADGMFLLGMMYAEGKYVEKNKDEAVKYLSMADENGFEKESPSIQEIIDNL